MLYIHEISVAFEYQKQGIGQKLVQRVLNDAQDKDYKAISLTTRRDAVWNMPFYKKMGFVETQDATLWPDLLKALKTEINNGADPLIRCAMVKILP